MSIAGRAKVLLLLIFLAAGSVAAIAALLARREAASPPPSRAFAEDTAPASPADAGSATSGSARTPETGTSGPPSALPDRATAASGGVIRGELLAGGGVALPDRWTLHVGPHPWLAGHDRAADRRIEFEHGETTFEVQGLPLGGYLVEAIAPGRNCLPGNVMLVHGSEDQFVTIQLSPAGFVDGGVLDSEGRPADGLEVTLESVATGERATQTTDVAGNFVFRSVRDGEYRILFGRPDSPLLPPQSLVFQAPSMRFPTRTLPPSATLVVTVVDPGLHPIAGARISGSAAGGGAVDTSTDASGSVRVRFLPPGTYRIDARTELGLRGGGAVALAGGKDGTLRIVLRDPKRP